MSYQPQRFTTPDGTEMVVLPAADYERLLELAEDRADVAAGRAALAGIAAGEGTVPGAVVNLMLDEGLNPLAAWRRYRGLSQSELARRAGLSQVWVNRIEAGGGHGSPATRRKLADALGAPVWALEGGSEGVEMPASTGKGAKYEPLREHLAASELERVTMRFDDVAKLVGGLPKSATEHRPWWANHEANSQALGWMRAGYAAEPDMARRVVVFRQGR
jgi:transcriptional regulator with XRE-family HTH domain